ncbi:MAG: sensor histidine kinase [Isosphaeraceae bacterium]
MKPTDRPDDNGEGHDARIPWFLREATAVAIARLDARGAVLEANRGFLRATGQEGRGPSETGWDAGAAFIQPRFEELAALPIPAGDGGDPIFRGFFNLVSAGSTPASLRGCAYRSGEDLLIVAEHDPEEWDHLRVSVLALNRELAESQRQLVRDIQARRRAEAELAETNRGILALYSELEDKATALRRASDLKTRFLSNMSHEFRTPLNAILSLSRILLEGLDGELTEEQRVEVSYIRQAARTLSDMVNDLLDLAKIEAGKTTVRPEAFEVSELFAALRGMMRPILATDAVHLVFDEPVGIPTLHTDQGKLAQILRNFLSNALKFTERGEVRVSAVLEEGAYVVFSVADTGVGISEDDQRRVFEDFVQIDSALQARTKGTGLGLSLSRQLAELLGGSVSLASRPGVGSTFRVRLPLDYAGNGRGGPESRHPNAGAITSP